uniref:C2 domain-containing protein n=1 Tax=Oryza meridionalis TaxID=40149 RepID=A0A0E0CN19_9ORYZ
MEAAGLSSWMRGFLLPSLWEAEVAVSAAALLVAALLLLFLDQAVQSSTKSPASSSSPSSSPTTTAAASCRRDGGCGCSSTCPNSRGRTSYVIKLELLSAKYLIGANLNGSSDPYAVISCGEQKRFSSMVPSSRNPLWGEEFNFLVRELPVEVTITMYDWDTVCKCKVIGSVTVAVLCEDETGATWFDLDSKSGQICLRFSSAKVFPTSERLFTKVILVLWRGLSCTMGIKRSQHSLINPAITIFLRTGSGGHGTPPSCSQNGRIRYKFTSFWNRNRTFRALENALQSYRATLEAEKQVRMHSLQQRRSSDVICSKTDDLKTAERSIEQAKAFQPFINEHVLVDATSLSKWYPSDEYGGKIREVMFRSLCHSPLCPPDTAVTEWQRASFSKNKTNLIYETKHQAHDVPFGSYFEVASKNNLQFNMSRVNMKKWCILQSKIKSGATDEYRREVCKILEAACDYVLKEESNNQASHEIEAISLT